MASLIERPESKYFIACFTNAAGRRLKKSTKTTNRKLALKLANEFEEAATKKRTARQVRAVISELHREITGAELVTQSFREFSKSWLERKAPEVAPGTLGFYKKAMEKYAVFLGEKADAELSEITSDDIVNFRNAQSKTLAPKTVNHDLKALKMLFRAARADKILSDDPTEFVAITKKGESVRRRPFTVPELKALLSVADAEWKSMIHFGLYTGQRLGDIATLTWRNVDLERGEIRLTTQKTGRVMILPIAAPLRRHLEAITKGEPDAPLHPRAYAILKKNGRAGAVSGHFADLLAQAGLQAKKTHHKRDDKHGISHRRTASELSFHCLRHTAVSMLKDAGVPVSVVMALTGHDSAAMSELYTHTGLESMEKAAASLPDLGV